MLFHLVALVLLFLIAFSINFRLGKILQPPIRLFVRVSEAKFTSVLIYFWTSSGSGAFSEVYKVQRKSDKKEYALKKVRLSKLTTKEKDNAINEVRILASINHENIAGYKEAFFEQGTSSLCIVMEYANGGDLQTKINQHKKTMRHMKEEYIWSIFYQMVSGLHTLHKKKIVHRDIKCANVFLTKEGTVKLGDLNVSKIAKAGVMQT